MSSFKEKEEKLEKLRLENEVADEEVSLAQKKAAIRAAKKQYGPDFKKVLGILKSVKVNSEALQDLHSMGVSGEKLRELTDPFKGSFKRG